MTAQAGFRVTYATLSIDDERLHADFDRGVETALSWLGEEHAFYVDGAPRQGVAKVAECSPWDRDMVVGEFAQATRDDICDAASAARAFAPEWAATPWQERSEIMRRGADLISERRNELAALVSIEVGKSRLEALGEVEETADLIRYYCHQMGEHHGFDFTMGQLSPTEHTRSVLRPHGVWGVISPFNYPMALAGGPAGAALVAGNTVVLKPAHQGVFSGIKLYEALRDGGLPSGALQIVTGAASDVGRELAENPELDGLTFTGSYAVGMDVFRKFSGPYPKPAICEMGGKNPAIVTGNADLELATEGVMRSAFGYSGQKCSACSRVYVEARVGETFLDILAAKTADLRIGNPLDRGVYIGPVIDERAVARFEAAVHDVKSAGGAIVAGGDRLTQGDFARGNIVATIVEAPSEHRFSHRNCSFPSSQSPSSVRSNRRWSCPTTRHTV